MGGTRIGTPKKAILFIFFVWGSYLEGVLFGLVSR